MRRTARTTWMIGGSAALVAIAATTLSTNARGQEEAGASCSPPTFAAQLMTPMTDRTPRDASLVVGLFPGGAAAALPTLTLERGRRTVALRSEPIAPGLYRVTPDVRRISGRYRMTGVAGDPEVLFRRAALPPAPTRPQLEAVERYIVASDGTPRTELRARFGFPVPSGVVAVLSYYGDDATPDLFARAMPERTELVLWSSSGRCPSLPEGASAPPESGTLRVAFVDQYGQLSQPSEPASLAR